MENYKKLSLIIPINSSVEHYVQFFDGCLDYFVNPYYRWYTLEPEWY